MPLFMCSDCYYVENTGTSNYWMQEMDHLVYRCSACDEDFPHVSATRKKNIIPYGWYWLAKNHVYEKWDQIPHAYKSETIRAILIMTDDLGTPYSYLLLKVPVITDELTGDVEPI